MSRRAARELRRTAPAVALLVTATIALVAPVPSSAPRRCWPPWPSRRCDGAALPRRRVRAPPRCAAAVTPPAPAARRAFAAGCLAIALLVAVWFGSLWPAGLNGRDGGPALALADVAAGDYTLTLMTILAGLLLPLLLALQAWSYWLFRERVTRAAVGAPRPSPST